MTNEIIFIATVLLYLGSVLLLYKFFGKNGLFAFAIFGTLLGNIAVCKCVDIFGVSTTAGNVLYASTEGSKQGRSLQLHDNGSVDARNPDDHAFRAQRK